MKNSIKFLLAIILMVGISLIIEYRLIYQMFFTPGFVSHRLEGIGFPNSIDRIILRGIRTFLYGQYHAASLHTFIILPTAVFALLLSFWKRGKEASKEGLLIKMLILILGISIFAETITGWDALLPLKEEVFILRTFNFGRFTGLFPLLWYVVFALSLATIYDKLSPSKAKKKQKNYSCQACNKKFETFKEVYKHGISCTKQKALVKEKYKYLLGVKT